MGNCTVRDISGIVNLFAPEALAAEFDNTGFQVGDESKFVTGIVIALDCTERVIDFAVKKGCNLIITHHPLIFSPLKSIKLNDAVGSLVVKLIQNDIALYSMHTNFDRANGGTDDVLAQAIGMTDVQRLEHFMFEGENMGFGRIGKVNTTIGELRKRLETAVGGRVITTGCDSRVVCTVASAAGAGGSLADIAAFKGADIFVTGEVNYHTALDAKRLGMDVMLCSHQGSEAISLNNLKCYLQNRLNDVECNVEVVLAPFELLWL